MKYRTILLILLAILYTDGVSWGDGRWTNYSNGNHVDAITMEGKYIWAATSGGVVRWDKETGSYSKFTTTDGLADNSVLSVAVDSQRVKWFGTSGGVSRFDGSSWTTYTTANGLANNSVSAIAADSPGIMWFGTSEGISRFDGSNWNSYSSWSAHGKSYTYITFDRHRSSGSPVVGIWAGHDV